METQAKLPHASVGRSYGYGWQQMKKYFIYLFLVVLILGVAEIPTGIAELDFEDGMEPGPVFVFLQILAFIYWLLVWPVFQYGADNLFLKAARNETFEVKEMFEGFEKYLNVILSNLLVSAVVVMGLILLIVPGIIVACRLAFVPYLVMDRDMEAIAAVEKSWQMTRGHAWKIFGLGLLAIPIAILGLLMLIVGLIPAVMWISTSFASLYYAVELKEQEALPESELE